MSMDDLLKPHQLATRWEMSTASLAQWRYLGRGPAYFKVGANVRYKLADVLAYEDANTVKPGAA
ncbi:DNA-binding protein [Nocardia mangyaensis]|uniref:DNA-binding protein n=1 Tax=Nocardia mangyaensis TaxID=2213200 RepID=UPI0026753339|nr:DNA-binding protein [Nocardia mangyaensis]MDO3647672.1 DNA-binding protein [Nocardia mangyaensis]